MDAAKDDVLHRLSLGLFATLTVAGLAPLFAAAVVYRFFHSLRLFALLAFALLIVPVPALVAWRAGRRAGARAGGDDSAAALATWSASLAAALAALLAATLTAQTMLPTLVTTAQLNTAPYVLLQPIAAAVFALAVALSANRRMLGDAGLGARGATVAFGVLVLGGGFVGAIWFLAFKPSVGPGPAWLLIRAAAVAAIIGALARRLEAKGPRPGLAWIALVAGILNVAGTMLVFARMGTGE